MLDANGEARAEVFRLMWDPGVSASTGPSESHLVKTYIWPKASAGLRSKIEAIDNFEAFATRIESAFEQLLLCSSEIRDRATIAADFERRRGVSRLVREIPNAADRAGDALARSSLRVHHDFAELEKAFRRIAAPDDLFTALLERHAQVQKAKKPDGKREWVEHAANGGIFVRPAYRIEEIKLHGPRRRPYRFSTVRSFIRDLSNAKA